MKFNELLQKTRLDHNMSVGELSREVAASESTIQKYEEGTVMPDVVTLVRICKALNVTPNDLLMETSFSTDWPARRESQGSWGNFLNKKGAVVDLRKMTQEEQVTYAKTKLKRAYDAVAQGLTLCGLTSAEAKELMEKVKDME